MHPGPVILHFQGQTLKPARWYTETILPTTELEFINLAPEVQILMPVTGATLQVFTVIKCVFVKAVMVMNHCIIYRLTQMEAGTLSQVVNYPDMVMWELMIPGRTVIVGAVMVSHRPLHQPFPAQ